MRMTKEQFLQTFPQHAHLVGAAAAKEQAKCIAETLGVSKPAPNGKSKRPTAEQAAATREAFADFCATMGIPIPTPEHRFHPERKWRFDYAWPEYLVALEVEGGVWTNGGHTRGSGFIKNMEKYNRAAVMRWRIVRVVPDELQTVTTAELLKSILP